MVLGGFRSFRVLVLTIFIKHRKCLESCLLISYKTLHK